MKAVTCAAVDIIDALDKAFVIAADQHAYPFCKGPLMYHIFLGMSFVDELHARGTAYADEKMNPRWNPDS